MEWRLSIPAGMERQSHGDAETFRRSAPWHANIDRFRLGRGRAAADCREGTRRPDRERVGHTTRGHQRKFLLALRRTVGPAGCGARTLGTTHHHGSDTSARRDHRSSPPPRGHSGRRVSTSAFQIVVCRARRSGRRSHRARRLESRRLGNAQAVFAYASYRGLLQLAHEAPGSLPTDWSTYPKVVRKALVPTVEGQRRPRSRGRPQDSEGSRRRRT
jgi:hypothetical protein